MLIMYLGESNVTLITQIRFVVVKEVVSITLFLHNCGDVAYLRDSINTKT